MESRSTSKVKDRRHIFIPDCQVRPGVNTDHLEACGNYIADKRPDVIVCIGDFADMPSLGTHHPKGHIAYEGSRYCADINAVHNGMTRLVKPFHSKIRGYKPQMILTMGNHEDRITRSIDTDPHMEGKLNLKDLDYENFGWKVYPFLQPASIDGILYNHYFPSGQMGHPINTARGIISKYHQSCVAGHLQGRDIAYGKKADNKTITAIIAGSFYSHEEDYLNSITNSHWRGIYVFNEVHDGQFDETAVSLKFLLKEYI